jgi:hypothetical protein
MFVRYVARPEISGWTVYDIVTGRPAALKGLVLGGLRAADAGDVVAFLNRIHGEAQSATLH